MYAAHTTASANAGVSPTPRNDDTNSQTDAGATSDRRKLSHIFQRLMAAMGQGPVRSKKGSNCQSPRVQRCRRERATSAWLGSGSTSVTSLTTAQRTSAPSSKSWLSTCSAGKRPFSTVCSAATLMRPLPVKLPSPNRS